MTFFCKTGSIHDATDYSQKSIETRPPLKCTENFMNFGHHAFEMCERTDKQTDMLLSVLRAPNGDEAKIRQSAGSDNEMTRTAALKATVITH